MWIIIPEILEIFNIKPDSFCYCWSNKKYWDCCMKVAHEPRLTKDEFNKMNPNNYNWIIPPTIHKDNVFNLIKECLLCNNEASKSHTISNNWMRKTFNSDFVSTALPDKYGNMVLTKISINQASAIPIWCNYHDNKVFDPIDDSIDLKNIHHLNLLAYRALWREYKLLISHLKSCYTIVYYLRESEFQRRLAEIYKRSIETFWLTKFVENLVMSENDKWLTHKIFRLGKIEPIFLSSAIHIEREKYWIEEKHVVTLSIIMLNNVWYFILSYKSDQKAPQNLYRIIKQNEEKNNLIPFLNDFIWKNCENIICDESRAWELIQTRADWKMYENWAHDYIRLLN